MGLLGDHPWNTVNPIVLDMRSAERLGYMPVGSYAETVGPAIDWLVDAARTGGTERRTMFDDCFAPSHFDYSAEDSYLARIKSASGNP